MHLHSPLLSALLLVCLLFSNAQAFSISLKTTTLPYQLVTHPVSTSSYVLQTTRRDSLVPLPQNRRLPLTIYQPLLTQTTCPAPSTTHYTPTAQLTTFWDIALQLAYGLPTGSIARTRVQTCPHRPPSSSSSSSNPPLLIFSHGSRGIHYLHQTLVPALASAGYTLLAIDHTCNSSAVPFPGEQTLVLNSYPLLIPELQVDAFYGNTTRIRATDVSDVFDAVEAGKVPGLERYAKGSRNGPLQAGVLGHSLGGATAAQAVSSDPRLRGGINIDGRVFQGTRTAPISVPFANFASEDSVTRGPQLNDDWDTQWEDMTGYKRWIHVRDAAHLSFTDSKLIAEGLGEDPLPEWANVGTVPGRRMLELVFAHVVGFFDMVFKGGDGGPVRAPSGNWPEVVFVRSDGGK